MANVFTVVEIGGVKTAVTVDTCNVGQFNNVSIYGEYVIISDIAVPAAASSVTITGLSITPGDEILLVGALVDANSSTGLSLYFNGNTIATNYYNQAFTANGTSISAARANNASCVSYSDDTVFFSDINVTKGGYVTVQTHSATQVGGANVVLSSKYFTSIFTLTSVTQITIAANTSNGIGIGSRFRLYRKG